MLMLAPFVIISVPIVDLWLQEENHQEILALREMISLGLGYDAVKEIIVTSNWHADKIWEYDSPPRIILNTPRAIFPQNAWMLVITFDSNRLVSVVGVRSMDSILAIPEGAPNDKE